MFQRKNGDSRGGAAKQPPGPQRGYTRPAQPNAALPDTAAALQPKRPPAAPPAFRPQQQPPKAVQPKAVQPKAVQPKAAGVPQRPRPPAAPAARSPRATPRVVQPKNAAAKPPAAVQKHPAAAQARTGLPRGAARPPAAPVRSGPVPFRPPGKASSTVQRILTLGGAASDAVSVATDAQLREGFGVWENSSDLEEMEASQHTVDITWNAGPANYTVSVNGGALPGAPTTLTGAVTAARGRLATLFASLDADVVAHRYRVVRTPSANIRKASGEGPFTAYSDGKSVATAVGEAINAMANDGTSRVTHSRLDSQPSPPTVYNFQVQLGGSAGNYRKGKGDTSETVVVIDTTVFDAERQKDANRWRQVMQAAHRESFNGTQKIEIKKYE